MTKVYIVNHENYVYGDPKCAGDGVDEKSLYYDGDIEAIYSTKEQAEDHINIEAFIAALDGIGGDDKEVLEWADHFRDYHYSIEEKELDPPKEVIKFSKHENRLLNKFIPL